MSVAQETWFSDGSEREVAVIDGIKVSQADLGAERPRA
jgi:hypothetical protein